MNPDNDPDAELLLHIWKAVRQKSPDALRYAEAMPELAKRLAYKHGGMQPPIIDSKVLASCAVLASLAAKADGCSTHSMADTAEQLGLLAQCGGREALRAFSNQAKADGKESLLRVCFAEIVRRKVEAQVLMLPEIIRQRTTANPGRMLEEVRAEAERLEGIKAELLENDNRPPELDEQYDENMNSPFVPIRTQWETLNAMMYGHGLNPTDFIVVTGREGLGKTTFSLNMLLGLAPRENDFRPRTVLYEFEMPAFQIAAKALSICSGVPTWKLEATQRATLDESELEMLQGARISVRNTMRCVDDVDGELSKLIARMTDDLRHGYDVFAIDILQELYIERELSPSHTIETICKRLRAFAKRHKVVVILLAHLRKNKKEDKDAPPTLADLKGGGIGGNATMAIALYSTTYNNPKERRAVEDVELHIVKNRMGKRGVVKMQWIPATGQYREWRPA